MDDREHGDLFRLDVVDEAVRTFQNFSNLSVLKLRDNAPRQWKIPDLMGSSGQAVNDAVRVLRRILCDVGVDRAQMLARGVRPVDAHFLSP